MERLSLIADARVALAVGLVRARPTLRSWLFFLRTMEPSLDESSRRLLRSHAFFARRSAIRFYRREIEGSGCLRSELPTRDNARQVARNIIERVVAQKTVSQCRDAHDGGGYYSLAESDMERQWTTLIEPFLRSFDLTVTLELAPGHGRNTEWLRKRAKELHLVDINRSCIDACRLRFGESKEGCRFFYYVNDGMTLDCISGSSMTFVYSFDSMVHFDKTVVRAYLFEFARVLRPGGAGFVHHSNYGEIAPDSDWASNHGGRSDVSAKLFRSYCAAAGLEVLSQHLHGVAEGRGIDRLDCVTIFRKPLTAQPLAA